MCATAASSLLHSGDCVLGVVHMPRGVDVGCARPGVVQEHYAAIDERKFLPLEAARKGGLHLDWASYTPPVPRKLGASVRVPARVCAAAPLTPPPAPQASRL